MFSFWCSPDFDKILFHETWVMYLGTLAQNKRHTLNIPDYDQDTKLERVELQLQDQNWLTNGDLLIMVKNWSVDFEGSSAVHGD